MKIWTPYFHTTKNTKGSTADKKSLKVERMSYTTKEKIKDDIFLEMMEGIGNHKDHT